MSDDEIVERAAKILYQRGYPDTARQVLWAIGKADNPPRLGLS